MRITQSQLARLGIEQLNAQRSRLARTQEQAATGLRINRPSDDPVDYRTTLFLKDSLSQTGRFLRSIDLSRSRMRTTETAIDDAIDVVSQLKVTATEARSGTNKDASTRGALRIEVEQLFDQLLAYGNVKAPGGGYVFSGLASDVASFTKTGSFVSGSGTPPSVSFDGSSTRISVEIDQDVYIDVTRGGDDVFQGAVDVFATIGELWLGIDEYESDPAIADQRIDQAIGELDQVLENFYFELSQIGGDENKANDFEERLRLQEQEFTSSISLLEDADAFKVYSDLAAQEAALQASLQVTTRLLAPTLLDFI